MGQDNLKWDSEPFVSVVVLTLNQTDITCDFLDSTNSLDYYNYEILICDMGSTVDPTSQIDIGNYRNTRVVRSEKNLGCAGGRNWGVRQAKGEFVFIVDNDTIVTPNLIRVLLEPFSYESKIAVVCPKIRYYDNPDVIQYAGFHPINPYTGRNSAVGSNKKDNGDYDIPSFTFSSHGCASMIRKCVFNEVGYFPEKFFFYYEEMDWSARLKRKNYEIYFQPTGLIFHKQSQTLGKQSPKKLYYMTRNRILYMRRNTVPGQFIIFALFFTLFSVPKNCYNFISKGQFNHLLSFFKGIFWNLTTSKYSVE